jgi:hypothetical protein
LHPVTTTSIDERDFNESTSGASYPILTSRWTSSISAFEGWPGIRSPGDRCRDHVDDPRSMAAQPDRSRSLGAVAVIRTFLAIFSIARSGNANCSNHENQWNFPRRNECETVA